MKKIIIRMIAVAAVCCMTACSAEEELRLVDVTTLRLLPDNNIVFGEAGGSVDIRVETNAETWKAEANQEWVQIAPADGAFRLTADPNAGTEARPEAVVTVVAGVGDDTDRVTITVSQEGSAPAELSLEPDVETLRILYNGAQESFFISSNKVWTVVSDQDWCVASKQDERTMTISALENKTFEAMPPATVTITAGVEPNVAVKRIAVTQEGRPEVVANDLSAAGTSNCYVVAKAGSYMFNACVKGNGATTPGITPATISPTTAELLWQDYYAEGAGLIDDVKYENGYIYFSTGETFHAGNALIAARDAAGEILWSWHIWCVADLKAHPYNSYETATEAFTVLDRNIGALSNQPGSDHALGLYYQWGRKDPFPAAAGNGDGQRRNDVDLAFGSSTPDDYTQPGYTASMYDASGAVINSAENMRWKTEIGGKQIEDAVRNPMCFYYQVSYSKSDWLETPDDNLWGNPYTAGKQYTFDTYKTAAVSTGSGVKTIYDPCPVGYKVAPGNIWCEVAFIYQSAFKPQFVAPDAEHYGFLYRTADGAQDWYPLAGRRQHSSTAPGKLYGVSTSGFMWMSSPAVSPEEASESMKNSASSVSAAQTSWKVDAKTSRAGGMPVRCVKE